VTCRECAEFLADYVAGELPETARAVFELHLARCRNCVTYLEQYRVTIQLEKAVYQDGSDAPARMPEELIRAILAAKATQE
jgi:anti-sigma factor RsiW